MWATQYHRISLSSVGESLPYIFISLSVWPIYFFFFPVIPCGTYVLLSYIMLSQIWSISHYTCNNTAGNDFWGNKHDKSQQRLCLLWHGCQITLPVSRKMKCFYYNFPRTFYMEYGAVGDPWRNSKWKQFRLFRIVKIVNLRSGVPSSILVWRLGEKDAWYFIFSLSLRKKTPDRRLENSGKNMQRFFFPLEGFEKTIHCLWSKYSKPHVKVEKSYLIRHLILPLILIAKRRILRFRWVATEEVHMGEAWGKNPLPCPFIWTSTPKSLVYIMSRKHHATDLKNFRLHASVK